MARHDGVTFKRKKYNGKALHKSDVLPQQFSGRRRPAERAHEGRFLLQVDRQTKEIVPDVGSRSKSANGSQARISNPARRRLGC